MTQVMTQLPFLKDGALSIRALSVFCALLLLTACSGSRLGDTVGKSLEPDPQLLDPSEPAATTAAQAREVEPANAPEPAASKEPAPKNESETAQTAAAPSEPAVVGGNYTDIAKAPEELQEYLVDLLELELLEVKAIAPTPTASKSDTGSEEGSEEEGSEEGSEEEASTPAPQATPPGPNEFRPNQAVTRREYARWLLAVNNRYYSGQRNRKIRPGVTSSQPVFQDVGINDPDFAAIQGLAEAGIIPSPLTGSSTTITFRPNAPLTRKDLLLWKVPLDTRQPLPQATPQAVEEAWGFQDAAKIDPRPLQAVLADYQNGDFSNIRRAFGYTTLFQPAKAATRAETAAVLWRIGNATEAITAAEIRNPGSAEEAEGG